MERSIIVTDLTRFTKPTIVCTAGVDPDNGECIRPMPYLTTEFCKNLKILPGAVLKGSFSPGQRNGPHQEDYNYTELCFEGPSKSADFRQALLSGLFPGVEAGFEIDLQNKKHIPVGHTVQRSLITVRVSPDAVRIVEDSYRPGKIKLNFTDETGQQFRYIGITDLGFHDHAQEHRTRQDLEALNRSLREQDEVLLRIGLSRAYRAQDGREGYWLQANGIYTFPNFNRALRGYV